jgi:predicted RNA-binding Zn ribbon-like protein
VPAPRLDQGSAVDLLNTIWADRSGVHDELADAESAGAWLGLRLSSETAETLRGLRDAARVLAAARTADPRPVAAGRHDVATAVDTLNRVSSLAPGWPVLVDGRATTATEAAPVDRTVGRLAGEVVALLGSDTEVRACLAPGCVLYFVKDHPRRAWCSTACGNRERAARHYARSRRS